MALSRVRGITIEIGADTSKVTKALSTFNKATNNVRDTLKDIDKLLKFNPGNTELLTQKQEQLKQKVKAAETQLIAERNALEQLGQKDQTSKVVEEQERLRRQIVETERAWKDAKRELELFGSVGIQQMKAFGEQITAVGQQIKGIGDDLISAGYEVERLTAPLQGALVWGGKQGMDFEKGMSSVKAVTGATSEEFEALTTAAREMARQTVFSASEVAEAEFYMGLAGWEAQESIDGLAGVLDLAAAGQVDLGRASSIVVDGITAMGYSASDSTHFVNVMAAAMSNSNTTVDLLGESFKYAAPLAGTLGYNIEDLTLGLGLMASAGIKGSQAGTGLRMALNNMSNEAKLAKAAAAGFNITLDNGYGEALPFRDVIVQLRDQFGGLNLELLDADGNLKTGEQLMDEYGDSLPTTQMEKFRTVAELVGVRALPGVLGMIQASEEDFTQLANAIDNAEGTFWEFEGEIIPLTEAVETFGEAFVEANGQVLGAAEGMRKIQLDNLSGQITLLKDNLADLGIELYQEIRPALGDIVEWIGSLAEKFRNASPATKKFITTLAMILAAIGPILIVGGSIIKGIGMFVSLIGGLISGISTIATVLTAVAGVLGVSVGWILVIIAVIGALIYAITNWGKIEEWLLARWEEFKTQMSELWEEVKANLIEAWEGVKEALANLWEGIKQKASDIWNGFKQQMSDLWEEIKTNLTEAWEGIKQIAVDTWEAIKQFFANQWEEFKKQMSELWEEIKGNLVATWNFLKETASNIWEGLKNAVIGVVQTLSSWLSGAWEGIKSTASRLWEGIKNVIVSPIEKAWNLVKSAIDKIKGLFPLSLGKIFSNIKLPHFSISGGKFPYGLFGSGSLPKISIDWYKKAMQNGIRLDGATIFGMNKDGQPMGGGEAGAEWIVGQNSLLSMIQSAVGNSGISPEIIYEAVRSGIENADINVYMDGRKVTDEITRTITARQQSNMRYMGV